MFNTQFCSELFTHSRRHFGISTEKPKPFTQSVTQKHLWGKSAFWTLWIFRRLTKILICGPSPGWASPWWSWPVWSACATCWPRTSDWDGTCESRLEEEWKILGTSGRIQLGATLKVASTGPVHRRCTKPSGSDALKTDCLSLNTPG